MWVWVCDLDLTVYKWDYSVRYEKIGIIRKNFLGFIHITNLFKHICFSANKREWSYGNQRNEVEMAQNS